MTGMTPLFALACATLLAACSGEKEGIGPFYLLTPEREIDTALFRCFEEDGERIGCERGHLPGPLVFALGGNEKYIVVARRPKVDEDNVSSEVEYFFFERIENESRGMGLLKESLVGPIDEEEFRAYKNRLDLPEFSIVKDALRDYGT